MMFQFPKVIAGCLVIPAVYGSRYFRDNFRGFTRKRVLEILEKNKRLGRVDDPQYVEHAQPKYTTVDTKDSQPEYTTVDTKDSQPEYTVDTKDSWYQLDLEAWNDGSIAGIGDFNMDPDVCVKKVNSNPSYNHDFYKNEKKHSNKAFKGGCRGLNDYLWWANHIVRQYLPDTIRFQKWGKVDGDSWETSKAGDMWSILSKYNVWNKFLKKIACVLTWNQQDKIEQTFGIYEELENILRGKGMDGKKTHKLSLYYKLNKYYCWMTHALFELDDNLNPCTNRWTFATKDIEYNQVMFCARLVEILHFFMSKECITHMESVSDDLKGWLLEKRGIHKEELGEKWKILTGLCRRYKKLVMMLKPQKGEIPDEFFEFNDTEDKLTEEDSNEHSLSITEYE